MRRFVLSRKGAPVAMAVDFGWGQAEEAYFAGYRFAALMMYGDDWATCEFGWHHALTLEAKP